MRVRFECKPANFNCCYVDAGKTVSPIGYLDSASDTAIYGWACDPMTPEKSIDVKLFFDAAQPSGTSYTVTTDRLSELPIATACGGGNRHRWQLDLTPALKQQLGLGSGSHTVYAYPVVGTNPQLTSSPRTFAVP